MILITVKSRSLPTMLILCSMLLLGCTHNIKTTVDPVTQYSDSKVIDLGIELNVTPSFTDFTRVYQIGGYTYNFQFPAGMFAQSAESLAKSAFREVRVSKGGSAVLPNGLDAALTPQIVLMEEENDGGFIRMNLMLEWTLVNRQGRTVWKHTILGTGFKSGRESTQTAIDTAFRLSKEEISSSAAIAAFAINARSGQTK